MTWLAAARSLTIKISKRRHVAMPLATLCFTQTPTGQVVAKPNQAMRRLSQILRPITSYQ